MKSSKRPADAAAAAHDVGARTDLAKTAPVSIAGSRQASPAEVAAYIAEMGASLASLARTADLEVLAYLLDVAGAEATDQARAKSAKTR